MYVLLWLIYFIFCLPTMREYSELLCCTVSQTTGGHVMTLMLGCVECARSAVALP